MKKQKGDLEAAGERDTTTPTVRLEEAEVKPRTRAEAFCALIDDKRISSGAFRLWHCLYNHVNYRTGECFPGQRHLQERLSCSNSSLKPWTDALVKAGWLSIRTTKSAKPEGHRFIYTLLDGTGEPFLKAGTPTVPESRNGGECSQNQERSVPKSRNGAFPKAGTKHYSRRGVNKKNIIKAASRDAGSWQPESAEPAGDAALNCRGRF